MPSAPHRLSVLLCLLSTGAISTRTSFTALQAEMPSSVQMLVTRSEDSRAPKCFWNNGTDLCTAFAYVHPSGASDSRCENTRIDYPSYSSSSSLLSETECKAQTGKNGLACLWSAEYGGACREPLCRNAMNQAECTSLPLGCHWESKEYYGYCADVSCQDRKDEADCSRGRACNWRGADCFPVNCGDFQNSDEETCVAASSKIWQYPGRSKHVADTRCWWTSNSWGGGNCRQHAGCHLYYKEDECVADAVNWGGCQWNNRLGYAKCMNVNTCDDYETESLCVADAFGIGQKTSPGLKCTWKTETPFIVGTAIRTGLFSTYKTSNILKMKADHTLDTVDGSGSWELRSHLPLRNPWSERDFPIQAVFDSDGHPVNWTDIPTPIPDGFQLHMGSCGDGFPTPRTESIDSRMATACNHHDLAACATATTLFPCPRYCGWAAGWTACWLGRCSESCSFC